MVQVNAGNSIILSRIFAPRKGDCDSIDKRRGRWYNEGDGAIAPNDAEREKTMRKYEADVPENVEMADIQAI